LRASLLDDDDPRIREVCQWSRRRLKEGDDARVEGLRAAGRAHAGAQGQVLGNVWHLDTGG
jgi:serine/threonine protein phosphatase 1